MGEFESVLLTCHTKPGEPESEAVCLPPMRSQRFVMAHVRLPAGDEREVLFTEHRVHPSDLNPLDGCSMCCFVERLMSNVVIRPAGQDVCEKDCIHIHNIIEHAILREDLPLSVLAWMAMVSQPRSFLETVVGRKTSHFTVS